MLALPFPSSRRSRWKIGLAAAKLIAGGVICTLILARLEEPAQMLALIRAMDVPLMLAAAGMLILSVCCNALRWRHVLARMGHKVAPATALAGTHEGMFFNLFLPTGFGGDAARAYRAYDAGIGAGPAAASVVVDRAIGLWGLAATLALALWAAHGLPGDHPAMQAVAITAAAVLAGGVLAALVWPLLSPLASARVLAPIAYLWESYRGAFLSMRFLTHILPLLALSCLFTSLSAYLATRALGIDAGFAQMALVTGAASLLSFLPITIGGWGVREGTVVFFMELLGYGPASAAAGAAAIALTVVAAGIAGALVWIAVPYRRLPGKATEPRT